MKSNKVLTQDKIDFISDMLNKPKFLRLCKKYGYTDIVIGPINHPNIPNIKRWINLGLYNFVAAYGPTNPTGKYSKFPAIWEILRKLNIDCGGGNGHEHGIVEGSMYPCAYSIVNGRWKRLNLPVIDVFINWEETGKKIEI